MFFITSISPIKWTSLFDGNDTFRYTFRQFEEKYLG